MARDFRIKCVVSEEGVPGGLKIDAVPKSYQKYRKLFEAARDVRKIDDFRELRIPYYPSFRPFEYQREAVLMMLARFRGKGIFGDQPGLGKTVEVGMTISEYAVRGAVKNVLLLCPNKLDFQWAQEVREKFSEYFTAVPVRSFAEMEAYTGSGVTMFIVTFDVMLAEIRALRDRFRADIEKTETWLLEQGFKVNKSEEYAARKRAHEQDLRLERALGEEIDENYMQLYDRYEGKRNLQMLVIDEADALLSTDPAHTLQIYKVAEHIGRDARVPYKILLSATPIRRQLADVYSLMKIVRPDRFRDRDDFIKNYCFGKARLNDFKGEELGQLKGLIDQLFTRNRLSSRTVTRSLAPLTIEEVLDVNFRNFAAEDLDERARQAVIDGIAYGEASPERTRAVVEKSMAEYCESGGAHWTDYVRAVLLDSELAPVTITDEKNRAFSQSMIRRIQGEHYAEADALRFDCEDYSIPRKCGHEINYKWEIDPAKWAKMRESDRKKAENDAYDDAITERYKRKAARDAGLTGDDAAEYYDRAEIAGDSKYVEFDRLVNEVLRDEKVLVFSDAGVERNTYLRLVESGQEGRALSGEANDNRNYLRFASAEKKYKNAVYFALSGEEKGFNMQFCSSLVITNLPHDPNLTEQIVGRVSRIGQRRAMHVYVFTPPRSLEHSLYLLYNDVLHLFSDWDGDNTFIIGGAVASFLEAHPEVHAQLLRNLGKKRTQDGERTEVGFSQLAEYLYNEYENSFSVGSFETYAPWAELKQAVVDSMQAFRGLVRELGEQEMFTQGEEEII